MGAVFTYSTVRGSAPGGGAGVVAGGGGVELLGAGVSTVNPVPSSRRRTFGGCR